MVEKVEIGEMYYTHQGEEVQVVTVHPVIIVQSFYEDEWDECEGRLFQVSQAQLFDEPPTGKLHSECEKLKAKIEALRKEHDEARIALSEANRELENAKYARLRDVKEFAGMDAALENLEQALHGGITHFVEEHGGEYAIHDIAELSKHMSNTEHYVPERKYCIMYLALKSYGDSLTWEVRGNKRKYNEYLAEYHISIFPSHDDAVAFISEAVNAKIADGALSERILETAKKYNIAIPDDYEERLKAREVQRKQAEIDKKQAEIDKKIKELNELKGDN